MPAVARIQRHARYTITGASSSWSHRIRAGANRMLLARAHCRNNGTITPPTHNGVSLSLVSGSQRAEGSGTARREVAWYYLLDASLPAGDDTKTLALTVASADSNNAGLEVWNLVNVDQANPFRDQGGNQALNEGGSSGTAASLVIASADGDLVVSALYSGGAPTIGSGMRKVAGAGVSTRAQIGIIDGAASSTTVGWTFATNPWVHAAFAIRGSAATQPDIAADYTGSRGKQSWIISGLSAGESLAAGSTTYSSLAPSVESSGDGPNNRTRMTRGGTFRVPGYRVLSNAATAGSLMTLQVNGVDSGVTVAIGAGATGWIPGTGTLTVSAGDDVGWKQVIGAGGAVAVTYASLAFEADDDVTVSVCAIHSSSAGKLTPGSTTYFGLSGSRASVPQTTEFMAQHAALFAAGWEGLSVLKVGTTTDGPVVAQARVNGADATQVNNWSSGGSATQYDTAHSDAVADGDLLSVRLSSAGSTGDFEHERLTSYLINEDGEFLVMAGSPSGAGATLGNAGDKFVHFGELSYSATEATTQLPVPFDMAVKRLVVLTGESTNTVAGEIAATVRKGGVDTAATLAFLPQTEHILFADLDNVANFDAGELLSIKIPYGGSNNAQRIRAVAFVAIERVSGGASYSVDQSESAAAAEGLLAAAMFGAGSVEAAAASDAPASTIVALVAASAPASAGDAATAGASGFDVSVAEPGSAADTVSAIAAFIAARSEALAAADGITVSAALLAGATEAAAAADASSWGGGAYPVDVAETATLADAVSTALAALAASAEAGNAGDGLAVVLSASAAASGVAAALDAVQAAAAGQLPVDLMEASTAADVCTVTVFRGIALITVRPARRATGGAARPANLSEGGR